MLPDSLDHLPDRKQRELACAVKILFGEFEQAVLSKQSERKKDGRILKVILFGSYARGDWVEDNKSGYRSDYDLLVIVNAHTFTDQQEFWQLAAEHLSREQMLTRDIQTPVSFIVHSYADVNDQLARGRPFFVDIARDGIVLYEEPGHPLATPKPLTPEAARTESKKNFEHWFPDATEFVAIAGFCESRGNLKLEAFNLHQATERFYHCALLTLKLYSPKSHRLKDLRQRAEAIEPRLIDAWPRDTKFARRCFERLDRAYVDARYSPTFAISAEELDWLVEHIKLLQQRVQTVCLEHLHSDGDTIS